MGRREGGREGTVRAAAPPRHTYKHPHSLPPSFPALLGGVITVPIIIHASQRCSHAGRDVDAHKQPKSPAHLAVASEHKGPLVLSCTLHFVFLPDPSCPGLSPQCDTVELNETRTRYCCYATGLLVLSCC